MLLTLLVLTYKTGDQPLNVKIVFDLLCELRQTGIALAILYLSIKVNIVSRHERKYISH